MQVNHTMEQRSKALFTAAPWKDARGRRELLVLADRLLFRPCARASALLPLVRGKGFLSRYDRYQKSVSTKKRALSLRVFWSEHNLRYHAPLCRIRAPDSIRVILLKGTVVGRSLPVATQE